LLSAGVAHEINTPLTGISSYVQMLQKKLTEANYLQVLKKIEDQTDRVSKIVKNLLSFARNPADPAFHRSDLKESLEEIISLIDYRLKSLNINLVMDLKPVIIYAQKERLQQVFINIILNALDAMPGGGQLTIQTRQQGRQAIIKIADTGLGIKPEHLPRVFDPFLPPRELARAPVWGFPLALLLLRNTKDRSWLTVRLARGRPLPLFCRSIWLKKI